MTPQVKSSHVGGEMNDTFKDIMHKYWKSAKKNWLLKDMICSIKLWLLAWDAHCIKGRWVGKTNISLIRKHFPSKLVNLVVLHLWGVLTEDTIFHLSLGVGDACFFLTMRCFNDAMFSNS